MFTIGANLELLIKYVSELLCIIEHCLFGTLKCIIIFGELHQLEESINFPNLWHVTSVNVKGCRFQSPKCNRITGKSPFYFIKCVQMLVMNPSN